MIVIHNNLIPLGKARTINFFGVLFTKNKNLTPKTENHEAIHTRQQIEWLILYATALLVLIPACGLSWRWLCTVPICYHVIALERECYDNQADQMYLKRRKWFAWVKYLFKRPVK